MASTATFTASVQYSPPSGPANSGSATFSIASSHAAQNVGNLDIPAGTPPGTTFSVPFGSVGSAKLLIIKNSMSSEIGFRMNGSGDLYRITASGMAAFSMPSSPTVAPITDATIVVYGSPTVIEVVQTFVFGD